MSSEKKPTISSRLKKTENISYWDTWIIVRVGLRPPVRQLAGIGCLEVLWVLWAQLSIADVVSASSTGGTSSELTHDLLHHHSSRKSDLREVRPEIDVSAQVRVLGPSRLEIEPQYAFRGAEFMPFPRCQENSARTQPNLSGGFLIISGTVKRRHRATSA